MTDVDAHQLTIEVDEAFAFRCPKVDALCVIDGNGINRRLRGPLEERMSTGKCNDLIACHFVGFVFSETCHDGRDATSKKEKRGNGEAGNIRLKDEEKEIIGQLSFDSYQLSFGWPTRAVFSEVAKILHKSPFS
jgi:hypothetical protein